MTVERLSGLV